MTSGTATRKRNADRSRDGSGRGPAVAGIVAAALVMVVGAGAAVLLSSGGDPSAAGSGAGASVQTAASGDLAPTGETSSMGVPVVETPGFASGTAHVAGVTVQGANWEMGQVPLDVAVRPFWTLTNTGTAAVTLGEPKAEVRQGCCPGPFALGKRTLAPGESTVLTFELSMHEGMDGWHDMGVYVPVETAGARDWLELGVTGDFRN